MNNLTQTTDQVQDQSADDTSAIVWLYLDEEIKHLGKPAAWYAARPARLAVSAPRSGRVGRPGFCITEIGCSISMKEFKRLEKLGRVRTSAGVAA